MSASSAPAAKASLLTLLKAATPLSGVQVEYAHPGARIQAEAIYFERTLLDEVAAALGQQRRNESYVLELVVSIGRDGDNAQACEERAWTLVAGVENVLRPPLGPGGSVSANLAGAVNLYATVQGVEMNPGIAPNGGQRIAIALMRIRCSHRK